LQRLDLPRLPLRQQVNGREEQMQFASVSAVGRVTRQPVQRRGGTVAFGLAVNRSWKRSDSDEYEERTTFLEVVAFGPIGKRAARLSKGDLVAVLGELRANDFTDSEGVERKSLQIVASEVEADSLYRKTSELYRTAGEQQELTEVHDPAGAAS
jgi:single-strand DNA-binding protein